MHATPLEWPRAAPAKASSFDLTPDGPLNAGFALSPLSTSSPRKQAWEAKARACASNGAFGSITPGVKTVALAEDTARGDGVLARRVSDDDATPSPRPTPRVIDAETILGVAAAAAARATPRRIRASPTHPARVVASTPRPTARALDFDPRTDPETHLERKRRASEPDVSSGAGPISPREQARDALLAFLDDKATLRFARRAQRRALSRWRDALNDASEHARERGPLLAAIRGWRLAAEATRARREVETLRRRVADATLVSAEPAPPPTERSFASLRSVRSPPLRIRPCACTARRIRCTVRWTIRSRVGSGWTSRRRRVAPTRAPIRRAAAELGELPRGGARVRAEARRDGDAVGCGAGGGVARGGVGGGEPRAGDGSIRRRRALGGDGAGKRASQRSRRAARRGARGGARGVGGRALGASARARRVARRVARARPSGGGIEREREHGGERGGGDGRDSPPRRSSSRSRRGAGSVRSEVEELEECAAAMRRQMRRRARGERVFARGREDDW